MRSLRVSAPVLLTSLAGFLLGLYCTGKIRKRCPNEITVVAQLGRAAPWDTAGDGEAVGLGRVGTALRSCGAALGKAEVWGEVVEEVSHAGVVLRDGVRPVLLAAIVLAREAFAYAFLVLLWLVQSAQQLSEYDWGALLNGLLQHPLTQAAAAMDPKLAAAASALLLGFVLLWRRVGLRRTLSASCLLGGAAFALSNPQVRGWGSEVSLVFFHMGKELGLCLIPGGSTCAYTADDSAPDGNPPEAIFWIRKVRDVMARAPDVQDPHFAAQALILVLCLRVLHALLGCATRPLWRRPSAQADVEEAALADKEAASPPSSAITSEEEPAEPRKETLLQSDPLHNDPPSPNEAKQGVTAKGVGSAESSASPESTTTAATEPAATTPQGIARAPPPPDVDAEAAPPSPSPAQDDLEEEEVPQSLYAAWRPPRSKSPPVAYGEQTSHVAVSSQSLFSSAGGAVAQHTQHTTTFMQRTTSASSRNYSGNPEAAPSPTQYAQHAAQALLSKIPTVELLARSPQLPLSISSTPHKATVAELGAPADAATLYTPMARTPVRGKSAFTASAQKGGSGATPYKGDTPYKGTPLGQLAFGSGCAKDFGSESTKEGSCDTDKQGSDSNNDGSDVQGFKGEIYVPEKGGSGTESGEDAVVRCVAGSAVKSEAGEEHFLKRGRMSEAPHSDAEEVLMAKVDALMAIQRTNWQTTVLFVAGIGFISTVLILGGGFLFLAMTSGPSHSRWVGVM